MSTIGQEQSVVAGESGRSTPELSRAANLRRLGRIVRAGSYICECVIPNCLKMGGCYEKPRARNGSECFDYVNWIFERGRWASQAEHLKHWLELADV